MSALVASIEFRGSYLKVFILLAASFSSFSFFSFSAGGVPVRLDAPESSLFVAPIPGLPVLDPRGPLNIELGPKVG